MVTIRPRKRKSVNPNEGSPYSVIKPFNTKLVEVPITVIIPPKIVAKDSGIKNLEEELHVLSAQSFTYGIIKATIGVLFKNAEMGDTVVINRNRNFLGERFLLNNFAKNSSP